MSVKENTEIDWYRDNCGEQLNNQTGFNRSDGSWVCEMCGYSNDVSDGAIIWDDEAIEEMTLEELMEVSDDYDEYDRNHKGE